MTALQHALSPPAVTLVLRVLRSHRQWTGRDLLIECPDERETARRAFEAPWVLVAHGVEQDPILSYGNRAALALWELDWPEFTRTPSRLTAEPLAREERRHLLETVAHTGYMDGYSGVRISSSGQRFRIARATVWNVIDERGRSCGQAAAFDRWEHLTG
jgi:hypothetical protein